MIPDNAGYFHAAYVAAAVIYAAYAASVWWRGRALRGRTGGGGATPRSGRDAEDRVPPR
ncbi:MAG: hypothetical protein ACREON_00055 [Gemmatimonadaceae bacterium]